MMTEFELTRKQAEYIRNSTHRWNIACGAVRSGKSYCQISYCIPARLEERRGLRGLRVILGATRANIERNVLQPLRDIYGDSIASSINSNNFATIFGEKVYCIGADNVRQVAKIRGSEIAYCAIDEATDLNPEVFEMLKSRLSLPWSCCDITTNPAGPTHWFKKFLDSKDRGVDIFLQEYTIYDNPFLPSEYVRNLEAEYRGTVWFDRYILGKWVAAEGLVYRNFADNPDRYILTKEPEYIRNVTIGVDFGGGTSAHAFVCVGFDRRGGITVLDEYREKEALTPEKLAKDFIDFVRRVQMRWMLTDVWADSEEQTLINGLRAACAASHVRVNIGNSMKREINDRIRATCILMGMDRFHIMAHCKHTIEALATAVWDSKNLVKDVRLDNGTTNIDSLDAMEYAFERDIPNLIDSWGR